MPKLKLAIIQVVVVDSVSKFSKLSPSLAAKLTGSSLKGLTLADAEARLLSNGESRLPAIEAKPLKLLITDTSSVALAVICVLSVALSDYLAGLFILIALATYSFTYLRLNQTESNFYKTLARRLTSKLIAVRSGRRIAIPYQEAVAGDIIYLEAGLKLAVDVRLVSSSRLIVDQFNLTGSRIPQSKSIRLKEEPKSALPNNVILAGSTILSGEGQGLVIATTPNSRLFGRAREITSSTLPVSLSSLGWPRLRPLLVWLLGGTVLLSVLSWQTHAGYQTYGNLVVLFTLSTIPFALPAEFLALSNSRAADQFKRGRLVKQLCRLNLDVKLVLTWLVVGSVILTLGFHIPPPLTATEIIVLELLLVLPPSLALSWDKDNQPGEISLNKHTLKQSLGLDLGGGLLVIINFLWYFVRHHLALAYLNSATFFYSSAITVSLVTLWFLAIINTVLIAVDHHKAIAVGRIFSNRALYLSVAISFGLVCAVVYLPAFNHLFGTFGLGLTDWGWCLLAATLYLCLKLLSRHTRKHTRHAIVELHRELGLKQSIR